MDAEARFGGLSGSEGGLQHLPRRRWRAALQPQHDEVMRQVLRRDAPQARLLTSVFILSWWTLTRPRPSAPFLRGAWPTAFLSQSSLGERTENHNDQAPGNPSFSRVLAKINTQVKLRVAKNRLSTARDTG